MPTGETDSPDSCNLTHFYERTLPQPMTNPTRKTILIVEDDAGTQLLLGALMTRNGLDPVMASNGQEAIGLLRQRTFDAIILDLMMPVASGFEVITFLESKTGASA